jgi:hypothetical protein
MLSVCLFCDTTNWRWYWGAFLATPVPTSVSASDRDHDAPDDWHISPRLRCFSSPAHITGSKKLITGRLDQVAFDLYIDISKLDEK